MIVLAPSRPASATDETFFTSGAPCPIAHCNPYLEGSEGLSIPVSNAPTITTTYTPPSSGPIAFNIGLGCTTGMPPSGSLPNIAACSGTQPSGAGSATEPFLYDLSVSTSGNPVTSVSLTKQWVSAGYDAAHPPSYPCTNSSGTEFPVDGSVSNGAPLFSDLGYIYVSDDHSMVKYNPSADSNGYGTCTWGARNPDQSAMLSWNAIHLPANGSYPGGYYLVGQGEAGPVVLANMLTATPTVTLTLSDSGGTYVTYNTISVVGTSTGARLYDSTQYCATGASCTALDKRPGALYAIDVTSPSTAGGTPTMAVAWSFPFEGPSGASPMLLPGPTSGSCTRPCGDRIYFDGSGPNCGTSCGSQNEHPTLFGIKDLGSTSYTQVFSVDFAGGSYPTTENGYCPHNDPMHDKYVGIQAAALEAPESGGSDLNYSVWAQVSCGPTLYRFDAITGAAWSGNGAGSIDVSSFSGLNGYITGSTLNTVTDSGTGHTVGFLGVNKSPDSLDSYVTALDLETGSLLWKVEGPIPAHTNDSPFHGQFPIAETSCGTSCTAYVLIAPTAGATDGANILGLVLH